VHGPHITANQLPSRTGPVFVCHDHDAISDGIKNIVRLLVASIQRSSIQISDLHCVPGTVLPHYARTHTLRPSSCTAPGEQDYRLTFLLTFTLVEASC